MSTPIEKVLPALAEAGCHPVQTGPGEWVAECPACKARERPLAKAQRKARAKRKARPKRRRQ